LTFSVYSPTSQWKEEVLQVITNILELLDICLTTTHFQFEDRFYQQKEGMAMGNSLSPVVSNIFMEHFEEIGLDTADHKPAKWLRYVDDTFVV
jgi:hypothetical protein